jgi:hypothetical protein
MKQKRLYEEEPETRINRTSRVVSPTLSIMVIATDSMLSLLMHACCCVCT